MKTLGFQSRDVRPHLRNSAIYENQFEVKRVKLPKIEIENGIGRSPLHLQKQIDRKNQSLGQK